MTEVAAVPGPLVLPDGIHADLSNHDHHASTAVGSSGLKLIGQSPLHYWSAYRDPNRERREPTPAMIIGTATHMAILEPGKFDDCYTVLPEGLDRRTKEGKALYAEIEATGKTPLSPKDWKRIADMAEAARRHPVGRVLFDSAPLFETSIFWTDAESGVQCKIRPDLMIPPCAAFPDGLIVDVKTTQDASPEGFGRSAWGYEMHLQAALYPEGFAVAFGRLKLPPFIWWAIESEAPHAMAFYSAPASVVAYGQSEVTRLRWKYADCLQADQWPGYSPGVTELQLPAWAAKVVDATVGGPA